MSCDSHSRSFAWVASECRLRQHAARRLTPQAKSHHRHPSTRCYGDSRCHLGQCCFCESHDSTSLSYRPPANTPSTDRAQRMRTSASASAAGGSLRWALGLSSQPDGRCDVRLQRLGAASSLARFAPVAHDRLAVGLTKRVPFSHPLLPPHSPRRCAGSALRPLAVGKMGHSV